MHSVKYGSPPGVSATTTAKLQFFATCCLRSFTQILLKYLKNASSGQTLCSYVTASVSPVTYMIVSLCEATKHIIILRELQLNTVVSLNRVKSLNSFQNESH